MLRHWDSSPCPHQRVGSPHGAKPLLTPSPRRQGKAFSSQDAPSPWLRGGAGVPVFSDGSPGGMGLGDGGTRVALMEPSPEHSGNQGGVPT